MICGKKINRLLNSEINLCVLNKWQRNLIEIISQNSNRLFEMQRDVKIIEGEAIKNSSIATKKFQFVSIIE